MQCSWFARVERGEGNRILGRPQKDREMLYVRLERIAGSSRQYNQVDAGAGTLQDARHVNSSFGPDC